MKSLRKIASRFLAYRSRSTKTHTERFALMERAFLRTLYDLLSLRSLSVI